MNFTSLNSHQSSSSYNDEDRIKRMNDRVSRLQEVSNNSIQESQNTLNIADSGYITEEDMMMYDPDMSGMNKYGSNNITGNNVPVNTQTPYSAQMQNGYSQQPYRANVDSQMYNMYNQQMQTNYGYYNQQPQSQYNQQPYYQQMQTNYGYYNQQPQSQYNQQPYYQQQQFNMQYYNRPQRPIYNGNGQLYSNIIPTTNKGYYATNARTSNHMLNTNGVNPQNIQYNPYTGNNRGINYYNNPYNLDPRNFDSDEDYTEEYNRQEELRKKQCESNVGLAMYFRGFAELAGTEFEDTTEQFKSKINDAYGFKPYAQIREEREQQQKKTIEDYRKNSQDKPQRYKNGVREAHYYIRAGITDENGNYKEMTKPVDPETGYRTVLYTPQDDEAILFNKQHFWDPYIKNAMWVNNFYKSINNRVKEFKSRYPDTITWEQLVGPEAKMCDYYDDVVTSKDSNAIKTSYMRGRWNNSTNNYNNNFLHSGVMPIISYETKSDCFADYDLTKQVHAANLSMTPDEIELSSVLNNSLQRDYDKKRSIFVDKMIKGHTKCDMAAGARQVEVVAAPDIVAMTEAEAIKFMQECEQNEQEQNRIRQEALSRTDNIDEETGGHIISQIEIPNPGFIPGKNGEQIPILKRTITRGVIATGDEGEYND